MNTPFSPPPGLTSDDTIFAAPGRWLNGSWVRFYEGTWQVKGGYERLTLTNLGGVCRSVMGWQDPLGVQIIAFGCHNSLKVWRDSIVSDITPTAPGATTPLDLAHSVATPLMATSGDVKLRVVQFNHGHVVGELVKLAGFTNPFAGINPNGQFPVVGGPSSDVNNFYVTLPAAPTATVNGGGPDGSVQVTPFNGFTVGMIDGTGGAGFGTGGYGVGDYGEPSTADYFPLTWSLAPWGGYLLANPRNQGIFEWLGALPGNATLITTAPARCTYLLVTPQRQAMALGCNEEVSGNFNPLCIRWSDIEDNHDWASLPSNNAGEYILEAGGRIVCGRVIGDYVLVWTTTALYLGTFLGDPGQTWKFERVGGKCGAISPGAPVVQSQNAAWIAPDRTFWSYSLGGEPKIVDCPIRAMFADHITQGQEDKIVGGTTTQFSELTWFWPDDRDGFEVSRALSMSPEGWSRDEIARSAYVDAGPHVYPIGVSPSGSAYWHEKGNSADGGQLTGYIESTGFYMGEADGGVMVNGIWPDFKNQVGPLRMTARTRQHPQAPERVKGPWTLSPGQSKRSFRFSARIVRVRFDFASAPAYARGGKPEFDVAEIGGR